MKKNFKVLFSFFLFGFLQSVFSCDTNSCSDKPLSFIVKDIKLKLYDINKNENIHQSVYYKDFSIFVSYDKEFLTQERLQPFSLFSNSYASCLSQDLESDDNLVNIKITSDVHFNQSIPKGAILNNLFVLKKTAEYTIDEYLQSNPNAIDGVFGLRLTEAPNHQLPMSFTVELEFETEEGPKVFVQKTEPIRIFN